MNGPTARQNLFCWSSAVFFAQICQFLFSSNFFNFHFVGFNNLTGYLNPHEPYFGATIGRYANRIANATFKLNGTTYNLTGDIHGGARGFDKHLWNSTQIGDRTIEFHLFSPDGDQGFPGNVHTITTFSLTDDNEIQFTYDASSDKTTPISLTNHGYWNLAGAGSGNIYGISYIFFIAMKKF